MRRWALLLAALVLAGCYKPTYRFERFADSVFTTTPCRCGCQPCPEEP